MGLNTIHPNKQFFPLWGRQIILFDKRKASFSFYLVDLKIFGIHVLVFLTTHW